MNRKNYTLYQIIMGALVTLFYTVSGIFYVKYIQILLRSILLVNLLWMSPCLRLPITKRLSKLTDGIVRVNIIVSVIFFSPRKLFPS